MIISDTYLKSVSCMYEVMEFFKDDNHSQRILPIVLNDAKIYKTEDQIAYIAYWEIELGKLKKNSKRIAPQNMGALSDEIKLHQEIASNVGPFIDKIKDRYNIPWEKQKEQNYKPILGHIGYEKVKSDLMGELIGIYQMSDKEDQDVAIDQFLMDHPDEELGYFLKALISEKRKEYKRAIANYNRAIKLKPDFAEAYYNRGNAYANKGDYDNAITGYNEAFRLKPDDTAAYGNKAAAHEHLGQTKEALALYRKFRQLANPSRHAAAIEIAQQQIKELEGK